MSFFFWPLCCLSFFDLPILISPLVSSNASAHPASVLLLLLYSWIVYIGHTITEELLQVQQIHSQNEHKIPSNFSYGVFNITVNQVMVIRFTVSGYPFDAFKLFFAPIQTQN